MLDNFFGKKNQEEIERLRGMNVSLEKDNENLRKRLSKREERISKDPARIQETEESLKKALTRIGVLEHEISVCREKNSEDGIRTPYKTFRLAYSEALDAISRISSIRSEKNDLITIYGQAGDPAAFSGVPQTISDFLQKDMPENGCVIFFDRGCKVFPAIVVGPPQSFDSPSSSAGEKFETGRLSAAIENGTTAAFVLAHAGESFIGITDSKNVLHGELVRTGVKEKHSRGGWSQKRFERLREEDIRRHAEKAADAFDSMMRDHEGMADRVILMGDHRLATAIAGDTNLKTVRINTNIKPDRHCGDLIRKDIWSSVWHVF